MICTACGRPLDDSMRFCVYCGTKVGSVPGAEPEGDMAYGIGTVPGADVMDTVSPPDAFSGLRTDTLLEDVRTADTASVAVADPDIEFNIDVEMIPDDQRNFEYLEDLNARFSGHSGGSDEDTIVFYAPSVLPQSEPDVPDVPYAFAPPDPVVPVPVSPAYAPPPEAPVVIQSTATVLQGAPAGVARPEPAVRPRREQTALTVFLSILLTLFFFCASTASLLLSCVQGLLSPDNLPKLAERIDVGTLLEDLDVAALIMDGLNPDYIEMYGLQERDILDLLSSPEVKAFAVGELTVFLDALARGDTGYRLNADHILSFVQDNEALIRSEIGHQMTGYDYDMLREALEDPVVEEFLNIGEVMNASALDPFWLRLLLSRNTLIGLVALCGVTLLLLFIVNRRRVRTAFLCAGIPMLLDGLAFTALGLILQVLYFSLLDATSPGTGTLADLFTPLRSGLTYSGLIVFAAGLLSLGLFLLLRRTKKK